MNNDNNIRDSYKDYDDYYEYEDDTLLSNMHNSEKALVKKAIKISGVQIYIKNEAFIHNGQLDPSMFGIHVKNRRIDATPFWCIYDKLKKRKLLK